MTVVDIKGKGTPRRPPLGPATSDAGRFFNKMIRDIETDLSGRRNLSRIERELIVAFCGGATVLRYLNHQVALGEIGEIDLSAYSTMASTMLRIGAKLGLQRRSKDVEPTLTDYARQPYDAEQEPADVD